MVANEVELDRIFGALADAKRRAILRRLTDGEATVGELASPFDVSRQAISKHLVVLEEAGLVRRDPEGRVTRCSLEPEPMREVSEWVERFRAYWEGRLDALSRYVEGEAPAGGDPSSQSDDAQEEPPEKEEEG